MIPSQYVTNLLYTMLYQRCFFSGTPSVVCTITDGSNATICHNSFLHVMFFVNRKHSRSNQLQRLLPHWCAPRSNMAMPKPRITMLSKRWLCLIKNRMSPFMMPIHKGRASICYYNTPLTPHRQHKKRMQPQVVCSLHNCAWILTYRKFWKTSLDLCPTPSPQDLPHASPMAHGDDAAVTDQESSKAELEHQQAPSTKQAPSPTLHPTKHLGNANSGATAFPKFYSESTDILSSQRREH